MVETVLPILFDKTESIDLNCRHGSLLAIGHIIHALSKLENNEHSKLSHSLLLKVGNVIPQFQEKLYFRGLGGELMKQACSDLIEKCSLAHLPLHNAAVIGKLVVKVNFFGIYFVTYVGFLFFFVIFSTNCCIV